MCTVADTLARAYPPCHYSQHFFSSIPRAHRRVISAFPFPPFVLAIPFSAYSLLFPRFLPTSSRPPPLPHPWRVATSKPNTPCAKDPSVKAATGSGVTADEYNPFEEKEEVRLLVSHCSYCILNAASSTHLQAPILPSQPEPEPPKPKKEEKKKEEKKKEKKEKPPKQSSPPKAEEPPSYTPGVSVHCLSQHTSVVDRGAHSINKSVATGE